jgi:class 3 adenylate cyclase
MVAGGRGAGVDLGAGGGRGADDGRGAGVELAVLDLAVLAEAGLYDPAAPTAADRRELLEFLMEQGCTVEEMVKAEARGRLFALAGDRILRPDRDRHSLAEVADRLSVDVEVVQRLWRALGWPERGITAPVASPSDVEALRVCLEGLLRFGETTMLGLARAYGTAMERIAHAEVAATRGLVADVSLSESGSEVVTARAWAGMVAGVPSLAVLLDVVHRHHLDATMRQFEEASPDDLAGQRLVRVGVGFVDLSGFTALSQTVDPETLSTWITRLEDRTYEIVQDRDGRVVKFIGDAAMFVATRADAVTDIATTIVCGTRESSEISARGGVAFGDVVAQDGDYFGPAVNLAARLVAVAEPGVVLASGDLADRLTPDAWRIQAQGSRTLRGYADPVPAYSVEPL